jgi:hypothetical protein
VKTVHELREVGNIARLLEAVDQIFWDIGEDAELLHVPGITDFVPVRHLVLAAKIVPRSAALCGRVSTGRQARETAIRVDNPSFLVRVKASMNNPASSRLAREAKAMVALAFRNGPLEDVQAGRLCPTCAGKGEYSHITDAEMKLIMKNAVDHVYRLLSLKENDPGKYEATIDFGSKYTAAWMIRTNQDSG